MKLIPPDNQDAGSGSPATRGDDGRFDHGLQPGLRRRFTFDVTRTARAALIALGGELDAVCADAFRRRFAEATEDEVDNVVIDMRDLTFIDSTGLALLLSVNEVSRDRFALWMVAAEDGPPGRIFRMTGTNTILPLVDEPPDF